MVNILLDIDDYENWIINIFNYNFNVAKKEER